MSNNKNLYVKLFVFNKLGLLISILLEKERQMGTSKEGIKKINKNIPSHTIQTGTNKNTYTYKKGLHALSVIGHKPSGRSNSSATADHALPPRSMSHAHRATLPAHRATLHGTTFSLEPPQRPSRHTLFFLKKKKSKA
jgi:hypothetical protein